MANISLIISGNPEAQGGFMPLITLNSPSFSLEDGGHQGFEMNPYYFVLRIMTSQTIFTLVRNNVKSKGASRMGTLKIAISIPKGRRMSNGLSPVDILKEVHDEFINNWMTLRDSVSGTYEFNTLRIAPEGFKAILDKYELKEEAYPHRPMSGHITGYVTAPEEKIEELLRDPQYTEFSEYKEIIIADNVGTTSYVPVTVAIPRIPVYTIQFNGQSQQVTDTHAPISLQSNFNPLYYDNTQAAFTIDELLNGKSIPGVRLEMSDETVTYTPAPVAKQMRYRIDFEPDGIENKCFANIGNFSLFVKNNKKAFDSNFTFVLSGEENNLQPNDIQVRYSGLDMSVQNVSIENSRIVVNMSNKRTASFGNGQTNAGVANNDMVSVQVVLPFVFFDKDDHKSLECLTLNAPSKRISFDNLTCRSNPDKSFTLNRPILLDPSWAGSSVSVEIKQKGIQEILLPPKTLKAGRENMFEVTPPQIKSQSILNTLQPLWKILIAVIILLLGIIIGFLLHDPVTGLMDKAPLLSNDTLQTALQEQEDIDEDTDPSISNPGQVAGDAARRQEGSDEEIDRNKMIELAGEDGNGGYIARLKSGKLDLTFDEIDEIYSAVIEDAQMRSYCEEKHPQFIPRVEAYEELANAVISKDITAIENIAGNGRSTIHLEQRKALHAISVGLYPNGTLKKYTPAEKATAIKLFKEKMDRGEIHSFKDIEAIGAAVKASQQTTSTRRNTTSARQTSPGHTEE